MDCFSMLITLSYILLELCDNFHKNMAPELFDLSVHLPLMKH